MSDLKAKMVFEAIDRLTQPIRQMAENIRRSTLRMSQSFLEVGRSAQKIGKSISDVGTQMSLKLTAPLTALGYTSVKTAAQFESYRASLKTVTGSQEKANAEFDRLIKFSSNTPYQLEEVMRSYIKLVSLGLNPSEEAMRSFGNTASAMNKPLEQMVEAVADAITGEFERLKEFGITVEAQGNIVAFTFQGVTTKVKKNAADIEKYLRNIGEQKFGNAMDEQMKTLKGSFSNFSDDLTKAQGILGDTISRVLDIKKVAIEISSAILSLAQRFQSLSPGLQSFIIKGALILAILGPAIVVIGQFAIGLGAIAIGIGYFGTGITALSVILLKTLIPSLWATTGAVLRMGLAFMATPVGWITAAIAALAVAGYLIVKNWDSIKTFWNSLWAGIVNNVKAAASYIMPMIDEIAKGINLITDNVVTRGISKVIGYASGSPASDKNIVHTSLAKVDTGGELRIVIDEKRRAAVSVVMNDKNTNTVVDQGVVMGGAL